VIDIAVLKDVVAERVLRRLDHRNLNLDVPEFRDLNPTAEHIVQVCWRLLAPAIPRGRLHRLVLWETERNLVEYTGG
jgi:6-pyruvoyltetrahydropterin/6-carboxytetrahydropterin synthase